MSQEPKKVDRRGFLYAGLGAIALVAIGSAVYIALNPPVVTQTTTMATTSVTTVPTTSIVTTTMPTTVTTTIPTTTIITTTPTTPKVTLEWWTVQSEGKVVNNKRIAPSPEFEEMAVKEFESFYPDIKVNATVIPWTDLYNKYVVALQAGKGPDIMFIPVTWAASFIYSGWLLNLQNYINEIEGWPEDFNEPSIYYWTSGIETKNVPAKNVFGVPIRVDSRLLFYNVKMLKDAGFDRAPRYYPDEVLEWGQAVTKPEKGQYGIGVASAKTTSIIYEFWNCWLLASGGSWLNKEMTECTINSPQGVDALQFYADLVNKYKVALPGALNYTTTDLTNIFSAGNKLGMYCTAPGAIPVIKSANPDLEFGLDFIPGTKSVRTATQLGGWGAAIVSTTKHPEQAWKFLKFITSTKWMALWAATSPARKSSNAYGDLFGPGNPGAALNFEQCKYGVPLPMHPAQGDMLPLIVDAVTNVVGNVMTAKDALDQCTNSINQLLAKYR
jgi:multiple sugar transport system substrate-binding protein